MPKADSTADEITYRELRAQSRHALPEWEVRIGSTVVGYVRESHYRAIRFFEAIGLHPVTGEQVSLEASTDFDNRVETVVLFWRDPLAFKQHLPWGLKRLHGLS